MSKTIPPEERGLGGANGFFDSNDSTYLEEEQMNKSMVSVIFIVLDYILTLWLYSTRILF
jgi:hypothetical protein